MQNCFSEHSVIAISTDLGRERVGIIAYISKLLAKIAQRHKEIASMTPAYASTGAVAVFCGFRINSLLNPKTNNQMTIPDSCSATARGG